MEAGGGWIAPRIPFIHRAAYSASQSLFEATAYCSDLFEQCKTDMRSVHDTAKTAHILVEKDISTQCVIKTLDAVGRAMHAQTRLLGEMEIYALPGGELNYFINKIRGMYWQIASAQSQCYTLYKNINENGLMPTHENPQPVPLRNMSVKRRTSTEGVEEATARHKRLKLDSETSHSATFTRNVNAAQVQHSDISAQVEARLAQKQERKKARQPVEVKKRKRVSSPTILPEVVELSIDHKPESEGHAVQRSKKRVKRDLQDQTADDGVEEKEISKDNVEAVASIQGDGVDVNQDAVETSKASHRTSDRRKRRRATR